MQNRSARLHIEASPSRATRIIPVKRTSRLIEQLEPRVLMSASRAPVSIKGTNVPSLTPDATITLNPAQSFQKMDGLGVNLSSAAWNNGAVTPSIDTLMSTMGASLYRVIVECVSGWEDTNDNNDPFTANTAYYNNLYSTTKFTNLWNTIKYLNDANQPVLLNVMGYMPAWLGGAGAIPVNLEDEVVEMEATMLDYAVHTKGLTINYFSVLNEQDWGHNEGPLLGTTTAGVNEYVDIVNKLITRMNALGLGSIQILGGETATNSTQYADALMTSPNAMARINHFGFHDYTDSVGQFAGFDQHATQSGYAGRNFWVTEYADLANLDNGGDPPNEWTFSENSTKALIDYLNGGASGAMVYDGIDAQYQHHNFNVSTYGMIKWDTAANTYSIRKRMYANAQVTRFVRPGMKRISSSDGNANLNQTTFYDSVSGQLAVIGQNLSSSSMTVQVNLGGIALSSLELYETNASLNMARQADAAVSGGAVTITIPAHTIMTLATPDTTAPSVTLSAGQPAPSDGSANYDFKIKLADSGVGGIDLSSLDNADIRVTGPNGFDQLATLVGTDYVANGSPRVATYRISAPGGFWDSLDNGTYSVALVANQIKDAHNLFAAGATLGSINVNAQFAVINPSGTLVINGTSAGDTFTLGTSGSNITVLRGVSNLLFPSAGITSILVNGYESNDQLNINASISQPIAFQGADGTNTIAVTSGTISLSGDPSAQNVQTINISGTANVGFATSGSIANLNLSGGTLSGSGDLTITQAATWSGGILSGGGALIIAGGATLDISVNGEASSTRPLQINGQVNLAAGGMRLLRTAALSLGANGILDLADNALLIDYAGASPISTIMAKLQSGYANGGWNGLGIRSSSAANAPTTRTLGIAEAANLYTTYPATFGGYPVVDNSAVLIRYTLYSDANLDRTVDIRDLYYLALNWQQTNRRWDQGDFNFDQVTNAADLGLLATNWQMSLTIPSEPILVSNESASLRAPRRATRMVDLTRT